MYVLQGNPSKQKNPRTCLRDKNDGANKPRSTDQTE